MILLSSAQIITNFIYISCIFSLLPFDSRTTLGFTFLNILNTVMAATIVYYYVAFGALYAGISTIIDSSIQDISLTNTHLNKKIVQKIAINADMKQFIEFHRNLYR